MKSNLPNAIGVMFGVVLFSCSSIMNAQPAAVPLDIQGLDQNVIIGARSRAMGGSTVANANDAYALFSNPAALSHLNSFEIRVGGLFERTMRDQTQNWVPTTDVTPMSALFEGLTGGIKRSDSIAAIPYKYPPGGIPTDSVPGIPYKNPWNMVQRQYDNLGPNWNRPSMTTQPMTLAAAMPLTLAGIRIVTGIGFSQVISLDNYYQNNNAMSPYVVGQERPFVQWSKPTDTIHIKWYQYIRSREGSVNGITPGLSLTFLSGLTVGGSVTMLSGSSDDVEQRVERGYLDVAVAIGKAKNFKLDTVYYYQSKIGTSTYSGNIITLGLLYQQPRYSIGIMVKPAMTLSRKWDRTVVNIGNDSTSISFPLRMDTLPSIRYLENGKDDVKFPLVYSLGLILTPTNKWTFAFDYEIRNLADVELNSQTNGTPAHPWVNSTANWRIGAEYRASDMLAVRGGYHEDTQSFAPDGSAIVDKPASGEIYSLGAGIRIGKFLIDFAYEYSLLTYLDIYQSNVNYNTREQHQVMMEFAYRF
jgi:long-subunit fatty acid transport protein